MAKNDIVDAEFIQNVRACSDVWNFRSLFLQGDICHRITPRHLRSICLLERARLPRSRRRLRRGETPLRLSAPVHQFEAVKSGFPSVPLISAFHIFSIEETTFAGIGT